MNFADLKSRIDEQQVQRILALSLFQPTMPQAIACVVNRCRSNDERKLWGVLNGEQILGVVEYYFRDDGVIYVCNIAVIEACRGQGVGRFMLAALQEKYNLPLALETDDDAVGFYRKCGFEAESFIHADYGVRRWRCLRQADQ